MCPIFQKTWHTVQLMTFISRKLFSCTEFLCPISEKGHDQRDWRPSQSKSVLQTGNKAIYWPGFFHRRFFSSRSTMPMSTAEILMISSEITVLTMSELERPASWIQIGSWGAKEKKSGCFLSQLPSFVNMPKHAGDLW